MPNDDEGRWLGATNYPDHRTCGGRAWCEQCVTWCYEEPICDCCYAASGEREKDYILVRSALASQADIEFVTAALERLVMYR